MKAFRLILILAGIFFMGYGFAYLNLAIKNGSLEIVLPLLGNATVLVSYN